MSITVSMDRQLAEKRGRRAESLAALHLALRGWKVVARNLRTPYSEVDMVAVRRGVCAVVEVKARANWQACEDALDWTTRRRLDDAADWIADRYPQAQDRDVEIHAVYVVGLRVRHVPRVWEAGD